jgi:hypothetical protein
MDAYSSAAHTGMECSVSIPRTRLRGLKATVGNLGRLGASVWLHKQDLQGNALEHGESFELDIPLPENESFPPRTLNAFGSVIRTGDGVQGKQWVVIRFHSLQFRGAERPGEDSARL